MDQRRLINTYDQLCAAGGGIAITPAHGGARTRYFNGWHIYRVGAKGEQLVTDKDAHWTDHGQMHFSTFAETGTPAERAAAALEKAKAWAAEKYGEQGPWKRNWMRAYIPERIAKQFPIKRPV